MFLRRCKRRKNGKDHTYWALVESVRTERGSRQRIVAYLGELAEGQESGWAQLGRLQQRCWRPAGAFDVQIQPLAKPRGKVKLSITWKVNRRWTDWAAISEGCYLSVLGPAQALTRTYIVAHADQQESSWLPNPTGLRPRLLPSAPRGSGGEFAALHDQ